MSEYRTAPVLVLDLDGTVRFSKNGPIVNKAEDVGIYPDVMPKINAMIEEGFVPIFVSNQGGVAFGYTDTDSVQHAVMQTIYLLAGKVAMAFTSFGHIEGTVDPFRYRSLLRKPEIGMLALAESEMVKEGVFPDWNASLMVGDRPEDQECAERAGVRFQWAWDFFNRPHPDTGRSPFCTYCKGENPSIRPGLRNEGGVWMHFRTTDTITTDSHLIECQDQGWYRGHLKEPNAD